MICMQIKNCIISYLDYIPLDFMNPIPLYSEKTIYLAAGPLWSLWKNFVVFRLILRITSEKKCKQLIKKLQTKKKVTDCHLPMRDKCQFPRIYSIKSHEVIFFCN